MIFAKLQDILLSQLEEPQSDTEVELTEIFSTAHLSSNSLILMAHTRFELSSKLKSHLKNFKVAPSIVYLNPILQTTDRMALKEIARQLALNVDDLDSRKLSSFHDYFNHILSILDRDHADENKPLVFVLQEFDLFALQPKQRILYNLFDACHTIKRPILVIGLTTRVDCVEMLEKRVKSRFSNRIIYFSSPSSSEELTDLFKSKLLIKNFKPFNTIEKQKVKEFNKLIEIVFKDKNLLKHINLIHGLNNDIQSLLKSLIVPLRTLDSEKNLTASLIITHLETQRQNQKEQLLKSSSILDLLLLVSIHKLYIKESKDFNFEMVYDEYEIFIRKNHSQNNGASGEWGSTSVHLINEVKFIKSVVFKAFQGLLGSRLIHYSSNSASNNCGLAEFRLCRSNVHRSILLDCLNNREDCPDFLVRYLG